MKFRVFEMNSVGSDFGLVWNEKKTAAAGRHRQTAKPSDERQADPQRRERLGTLLSPRLPEICLESRNTSGRAILDWIPPQSVKIGR